MKERSRAYLKSAVVTVRSASGGLYLMFVLILIVDRLAVVEVSGRAAARSGEGSVASGSQP